MKSLIRTALCFAAALLTLSSCTKEIDANEQAGQDVKITLLTNTRAEGDEKMQFHADDWNVSTLRMMGFNASTGALTFNVVLNDSDWTTTGEGTSDIKREAMATVKTGKFRIVFVANEGSENGLTTKLDGITTYAALKQINFGHEAFDWKKAIPMAAFYENIEITDNNAVKVDGTSVTGGAWQIKLDRLGIRIDIKLTLTPSQGAKWDDWANSVSTNGYYITITGIPDTVYLLPETDNSAADRKSKSYTADWDTQGYPNVPGTINSTNPGDDYIVTFPRIILPESYFTDADNAAKAMQLQISLYDGTTTTTYSGKVGTQIQTSPKDYTLPRNTYLGVNATIDEEATGITMGVSVSKWVNGSSSEHNENIKQ